jgi:hypothetical protein
MKQRLAKPSAPVDPRKNRLLAAIPETEWKRFAPQLVPEQLALGEFIY